MRRELDLTRTFDPVDFESWREKVGEVELAKLRSTVDGLLVEPLYVEDEGFERGHPGEPPFVRGARVGGAWRLVHPACGDDVASLKRSVSQARVGEADAVLLSPRVFDHLEDAAALAAGVGEGGFIAEPGDDALAWFAAVERLGGSVRFDPLGGLLRRGRLAQGLERAHRWAAELASTGGRPLLVDARPVHEAGGECVDEVAAALSAGVEMLRALERRGHPLEELPRRMVFAFACDADLFIGIAKLRAARLVWSKVLRALGIDGPQQGMRIHGFSSRRTASVLDPRVNVLRDTAAAFAAIAGGAEDVSLAPYDLLSGATPSSERLARNTQLLLRWESQLDRVMDPAGGSYYVEALTEQIARAAWSGFQALEEAGGYVASLTSGMLSNRLASARAARRKALAERRQGRVGVSRYAATDEVVEMPIEEAPIEGTPAERPVAAERAEKALRELFRESDRGALAAALRECTTPVAVLRGELLRGAEETPAAALEPFRDAEPFEDLRYAASALPDAARVVLVVGAGDVRTTKPVLDFARELVEVGGLRAEVADVGSSIDEVLASVDVAPTVVVAGSGDDVARALTVFRERGARQVLVAGRPHERGPAPDDWLHRGVDIVEVLGRILRRLGAETRGPEGSRLDSEVMS